MQVNGDFLSLTPQASGQLSFQGVVQLAFQAWQMLNGQLLVQELTNRFSARSTPQLSTGRFDGALPGGCHQQDIQQVVRGALVALCLQWQIVLKIVARAVQHLIRRQLGCIIHSGLALLETFVRNQQFTRIGQALQLSCP
jgi:hypothetical protein